MNRGWKVIAIDNDYHFTLFLLEVMFVELPLKAITRMIIAKF
ncbi:MAG: hypothetical protein AAF063_24790 [Cyanobacteria bacterium J06643_5]